MMSAHAHSLFRTLTGLNDVRLRKCPLRGRGGLVLLEVYALSSTHSVTDKHPVWFWPRARAIGLHCNGRTISGECAALRSLIGII